MAKLISSLARLEGRIREYQEQAEILAPVMPYNRAWYAVGHENRWLFGPSKFVGYDDLSAKQYIETARKTLDGRVTEGVLYQWAELVEEGHPKYEALHSALNEFCAHFGKKPNSRARIAVVKKKGESSAFASMSSDELVSLMVAVYKKLSPAQKSAFRKLAA